MTFIAAVFICSLYGVGVAGADSDPTSTTPIATMAVPSGAAAAEPADFMPMPGVHSFMVPGTGPQTIHFVYGGREALCHDVLSVFTVNDSDGSIGGILPGTAGWPEAVDSRSPRVVFDSDTDNPGASRDLEFQGGDIIAFRFSASSWLCSGTYYTFPAANPGSNTYGRVSLDTTTETWQIAWEDIDVDGGDFNDLVVEFGGVQAGTLDTTPPPAPSIVDSPPDTFNSSDASFSFTDDEANVSFLCGLDGGPYGDCVSPQAYSGLADGSHTFEVEAKDAAGNTSPPTSYSWTIDTGPCTQPSQPCELVVGDELANEVSDPSPCGATTAQMSSDASSATPLAACSSSKKQHCAWFYDDVAINGELRPLPVTLHQITPHIQFHYCLVWHKAVTSVDGMSASNVYKKYPWVYKGMFQDPVVGGLGTRMAKVTFSLSYEQCAFKEFGCFDSRNVTIEASIDAKAKDQAHPVTIKVTID